MRTQLGDVVRVMYLLCEYYAEDISTTKKIYINYLAAFKWRERANVRHTLKFLIADLFFIYTSYSE
jgi:hypothetical protein